MTRYKILWPFLLLAIGALFWLQTSRSLDDAMLRQKVLDIQNTVNIGVAPTLEKSVEQINDLHMVYCEIFPMDGGIVTDWETRNFHDSGFHPQDYAEIVDAVNSRNQSGTIELYFPSEKDGAGRTIYVYFVKMPASVIISACSKYSVITEVSRWTSIGSFVTILITFVIAMYYTLKDLQVNHCERRSLQNATYREVWTDEYRRRKLGGV